MLRRFAVSYWRVNVLAWSAVKGALRDLDGGTLVAVALLLATVGLACAGQFAAAWCTAGLSVLLWAVTLGVDARPRR